MADKKRILVVEDEESIRTLVGKALREAGFAVETAEEAKQALQLIKKFEPHLVLTDHDMPEMTGLDLLRDLRQRQNYVNVIFMSGRTDEDLVVDSLAAGADDYIRKPFRFTELIARVKASLRTNDLHKELRKANARLLEMVDHDDLSGLLNMRSIYERIDAELLRVRRYDRRLSCVMLDMDFFKSVNDQNDHLFGSYVLKEMGKIIREVVREVDFAARYGGDEFLVVLTETNPGGTEIFCQRLKERVESELFKDGDSEIKLTVSLGYVVTDGKAIDARELVRQADHNLYKAKEKGRNCFVGSEWIGKES